MSSSNSAAGQNRRVGYKLTTSAELARARRGYALDEWGLARAVERGWQQFWRRRHMQPPQVSKSRVLAPPPEDNRPLGRRVWRML